MGGGASKTKEDRFVDRVVVAGGERVDCVKLRPHATLADARRVIEEDRDDPEYPQPGIPERFVFDRQGVRVPPRREDHWSVQDALTEGEHLLIVDAESQGTTADTAELQNPKKDVAARPPTKTTKTLVSEKAAALGDQAAAVRNAVDAVEEAVDTAKTFADDTCLTDLLSSAFGIVETVSDAVPGARAVLSLLVGIHERFKAMRDLSENVAAALDFVAEVAKQVASAATTSLKEEIAWQPLTDALGALEETITGIQVRGGSGASSYLGKFRAWLKAPSDQEELDVCVATVREAMKDLNFGMGVQLVRKVDAVGAQLRAEVAGLQGGLETLLGEEFAELRGRLQNHLGVDAATLRNELQQLESNQLKMLQNQGEMHGDLRQVLANQEKLARKSQETLEEALDPLRDLDDAVIDDNMRRFAEGTRLWAFKAFDDWVRSGFATHRVFVLTAGAGVGKTGIMCKLARDRSDVVSAYHFCRHDDPGRRGNPKRMLMSIAYQLSQQIPAYRAELEALGLTRAKLRNEEEFNVTALFEMLLEVPLRKVDTSNKEEAAKKKSEAKASGAAAGAAVGAAAGAAGEAKEAGSGAAGSSHTPSVILIDALDECAHDGKNSILQCIQRHFHKLPRWVGVYMTTRPEAPISEALGKFKPWELVPESDDNRSDVRLFFERLLADHGGAKFADEAVRAAAVDALVDKSNGLFIYASFAREKVRALAPEALTPEALEAFPEGLDDFYAEQLKRIVSVAGDRHSGPDEAMSASIEWRVVELVTAAKEPLHLDTVRAFLGCSKNERNRAVARLSRFFPIRDRRLHVYHKSVRDWLTREDREYCSSLLYVDAEKVEQIMAEGCLAALRRAGSGGEQPQLKQPRVPKDDQPATMDYALKHGVAHLVAAGRRREARALVLENVAWLMARRADGLGIMEDCHRLVVAAGKDGDRVVDLVRRAVGLSLADLREDDRRLPGQLVGRLLGSSSSSSSSSKTNAGNGGAGVRAFVQRLTEYRGYGFEWWCPVARTMEQAGGACLRKIKGHTACVSSVSFSPDGTRIVSGSWDNTVRVWDALSGQCVLGPLEGHTSGVSSVSFSPDGTRIVSGSWDNTVRVWDALSGQCVLGPLEGHTHVVCSVSFSPDGTRIVSGSWDNTVRVWDALSGQCVLGPLEGHTDSVYSVSFSPDGTRIVSGSGDNTVRVWDALSGQCVLGPLEGHTGDVLSVSFSPDGTRIVSGSEDNTVRVWDALSGQCVLGPLEGHTSYVSSVSFSPDGTRIVSGSEDNTVRVWDALSGQCVLGPLEGHTDSVRSVSFSPDGTRIVSGSGDNTVRVWDALSGQCVLGPLEGHTGDVLSVSFSPDGTRIVSGSGDKTVRVWDALSGQCVLGPLEGHTRGVCSVSFSPDGTRIVSGSWDNTVRVWDALSGQCVLGPLEGHTDGVCSVSFSPDGTRIVSGSEDNTVRVWDALSGQCVLGPLEGHTGDVWSVSFSPDGTRIVSGSEDNTVRVWDALSGQCVLGPLEGHTRDVSSVSFSPDGTRIVSGSEDNTVRVWDALSGQCVRVVEGTSAVPADIPVAIASCAKRDLSKKQVDAPAGGADFSDCRVHGSRACARAGKIVHVLRLMPI